MVNTRSVRRPAERRAVAALGLGIGVLLATGCANANGVGGRTLGAQALQNPSSFEMRVLKDKHVTQAEFDEGTQVYIECLTAARLQYDIDPGQVGMASVWVSYSGASSSESEESMERCIHEVDAAENVWILQNHVSTSDLDRIQVEFVSCLRDAGVPIQDGSTFADAEHAYSDYLMSLPDHYENSSSEGVIADKAGTCQQDFQKVSGAQPLPGLQEALNQLDTSGW